jgi:hypothetical protein
VLKGHRAWKAQTMQFFARSDATSLSQDIWLFDAGDLEDLDFSEIE